MVDEPITIQILRDIRDEVRGTNKRLERHLDLDARVRALENTINPGGPRR